MASTPPHALVAIDIDTGALLSDQEAIAAADNPLMFRWVRWVNPLDLATEPTTAPLTAPART